MKKLHDGENDSINNSYQRSKLNARVRDVRRETERLTAHLAPEDMTVQSMPDVSPTKWHLAHTTWFFETFILKPHARAAAFHPGYDYLFNSYYDAVGPRHPRADRGLISRPSVAEVMDYRAHVTAALVAFIDAASTDTWATVGPLVELGLHHEQQHQELILMDIKNVLWQSPLRPAYAPSRPQAVTAARPANFIEVAGGLHEIGSTGDGFAFDNEGPRHKVWIEPFRIMDRLVTCGEYLAFIEDGGYQRPEFWLADGWHAVNTRGWTAPLYWRRDDEGAWRIFTLTGEHNVSSAEPVVHVSHYEADAYARWAQGRLPTEAEWEVALASAGREGEEGHSQLHPRPAPQGKALVQMMGEVWQWTSSAYLAYPRFRPSPGAVGEYNGKFMSGQMVLRGSCVATPAGHTRPTYRNFFPPAARWCFGGIRLATDT